MPATPTYGRPRRCSGSSSTTGNDQTRPAVEDQLVGRVGDGVAPSAEHAVDVVDRVCDVQSEHLRAELVQAQLERGHDAEVAAAATQRPVEIGVFAGIARTRPPSASTTSAETRY